MVPSQEPVAGAALGSGWWKVTADLAFFFFLPEVDFAAVRDVRLFC